MTSEAEAAIYLRSLSEAILETSQDQAVIAAAWRRFKAEYTGSFWPTPGQVAAAIKAVQKERREYAVRPAPQQDVERIEQKPFTLEERYAAADFFKDLRGAMGSGDFTAVKKTYGRG